MKNTSNYSTKLVALAWLLIGPTDHVLADMGGQQLYGSLGAIEAGKLLASDGMAGDAFGFTVSLSGNRALVGALRNDAVADDAGAAYVYDFNGVDWVFTQKLTASDGAANDQFGAAVSLDGDVALIGAFREDDNGGDSGAVYVFDFDGNSWTESQKITSDDGASGDWFGYAVSLRGDRAVVSAYKDDDGTVFDTGAVYVFDYDGTDWQQSQKLMAEDGDAFDQFGFSVSLDDDRLLVGAFTDDDGGDSMGSAYVFDYADGLWTQSQKLQSAEGVPGGFFGYSVSLSGNHALVGAYRDTGDASVSGAAYVFAKEGNQWLQKQQLIADEDFTVEQFGAAVSLAGDRALVGARRANANGFISGIAYVYDYLDMTWTETEKLIAADTEARDELGVSVSLSDGRALLGAYRDDDLGADSGSAYVFDVPVKLSLTVSGLAAGNTLTLVNQGADDLVVSENGLASFATPLFQGDAYAVTVSEQPTQPNQSCEVSAGNGLIMVGTPPDIQVVCVINPYLVAGAVKGLFAGNQLVVQNNGVDTLNLSQNGAFVFPVAISDQQAYAVSIIQQPSDPIQPCQIINGTGQIAGSDVNDVLVVCSPGDDRIFGDGFEFTSN